MIWIRLDLSRSVMISIKVRLGGCSCPYLGSFSLTPFPWQVVSRAHRMGASKTVLVEQLAMRDTLEHEMLRMMTGGSASGRQREAESTEDPTKASAQASFSGGGGSQGGGESGDWGRHQRQRESGDVLTADEIEGSADPHPTHAPSADPHHTHAPSAPEAEDAAADRAVSGLISAAALSQSQSPSSSSSTKALAALDRSRHERNYLFLRQAKGGGHSGEGIARGARGTTCFSGKPVPDT